MCESNYESENNLLAHISVFEYCVYIKIETVRGKTVPEIHATLNEVCVRFPDLNILNEEVSLNKDSILYGIQALPKQWQLCIDKQGDYIEGL